MKGQAKEQEEKEHASAKKNVAGHGLGENLRHPESLVVVQCERIAAGILPGRIDQSQCYYVCNT